MNSSLQGDRASYQQDASRTVADALAEVALDVAEGADIVMVKPALPYLDVLRAVADASPGPGRGVPDQRRVRDGRGGRGRTGWLDRERVILETLTSIKRAGASIDPHLLGGRGGYPPRVSDACGANRRRRGSARPNGVRA